MSRNSTTESFSQTGRIYLAVLDSYCMEYVDHEIRQLVLRPEDVATLSRTLCLTISHCIRRIQP